jgi:hypothetical protein
LEFIRRYPDEIPDPNRRKKRENYTADQKRTGAAERRRYPKGKEQRGH